MARIDEGTLKAGEKLESEGTLAKEFGVSQLCVREALRALELLGFIIVKRGKGAFILDSLNVTGKFAVWKTWASMNSERAIEVIDVREALDGKGIELICHQANKVNFQRMEENIATMKALADQSQLNCDQAVELDTQFHVLLSELSGNQTLTEFSRMINYAIKIDRKAVFVSTEQVKKSNEEHSMIFDALKQGDNRRAQDLLKKHIQGTKRIFSSERAVDRQSDISL